MCEFFSTELFQRLAPLVELLSTLLYMSCVLCVRQRAANIKEKFPLLICLAGWVKDRIASKCFKNNPHFTWRVVNEYESIKRHVDVFTSIMALIYNKQEEE